MRSTCWAALFAAALAGGPVALAGDLVRFDFETGNLQGWMVVEGQFDLTQRRRAGKQSGTCAVHRGKP